MVTGGGERKALLKLLYLYDMLQQHLQNESGITRPPAGRNGLQSYLLIRQVADLKISSELSGATCV